MVDRISTLAFFQGNMSDMSSLQASLAKLNRQISSGKKAETFAELNGKVERVSSYESKLGKSSLYLENNKTILARLDVMSQAIDQVQDVARQYATLITMRRDPINASSMNFQAQAKDMLTIIADKLNISVEGRHLFGGGKTDVVPIDVPVPANIVAGQPDDSYYNGDNTELTAKIDDALEITYGVRANDTAFQKIIAAVNTGIYGDQNQSDDELKASIDLVNEAVEELINLRARVNSNSVLIKDANDQHESFKLYWQEAVAKETDTDVAEASIRLVNDQTLLQATYQTFAKLSNLRLTNFLN